MKKKYGEQGFQVISVHTPEFDFEKERSRVEAAAKKFNLDQPIFMDNDYAYWKSLGNRYWPSFYLVDKSGIIRFRAQGEITPGGYNGRALERVIRELLRG